MDEKRGPVLASFAHPDDMEISAGGTLARWADAGRSVHLLILTNGDKGSDNPDDDPAKLERTRAQETEKAAAVLGFASYRILGHPDGELVNSKGTREPVVRLIREIRPETVVTSDPTMVFFENRYYNHSDHRAAGAATLDSVFPGAGNPHFFPEHLREGLESWQVNDIWLTWSLEPNHREDITGLMDRKLASIYEHKSQLQMFGYFEDWVREEAERVGGVMGVEYGEAFRVLDLE
ncbi:MAG: PIG-L deacetylase family protein [Actinomycetota bacterium]